MGSDPSRVNTAEFLINAASLLPSGHRAHTLLRSYYLTKSRKLAQVAQRNNQEIQNTFFSNENCCSKCSTCWQDGNFKISVKPIKFTKRKCQRMRMKLEKDGKTNKKGSMLKLISKKTNNVTNLTCKTCGNRNKITLWKKSQYVVKEVDPAIEEQKLEAKTLQGNKESKIDKETKVTAPVKANSLLSKQNQKKTKRNENKPKSEKLVLMMSSDQKPRKKKKPPQKNTNVDKTLLGTKKKPENPAQAMKRNSLLQLAAALKTKTKKTSNTNDKLKQMFSNK